MIPTENLCPAGYDSFYEGGLQCRRATESVPPTGLLLAVLAGVVGLFLLALVATRLGLRLAPGGTGRTDRPDGADMAHMWTDAATWDIPAGDGPQCDTSSPDSSSGCAPDSGGP